ncbi:MAG: hypothetical protein WD601_04845 [Pseudohongiellaceae bacterium]
MKRTCGLALLCYLLPASLLAQSPVSEDELIWIEDAQQLVEAAASGRAEARSFQRQVKQSRDTLRGIVRNAGENSSERHQNMILMVALLDAAAACHRAGHIVCPPDLMRQLRTQLSRLQAQTGTLG